MEISEPDPNSAMSQLVRMFHEAYQLAEMTALENQAQAFIKMGFEPNELMCVEFGYPQERCFERRGIYPKLMWPGE